MYFIALLLPTIPNTAWLSRACTAVEVKCMWPLSQESHDQPVRFVVWTALYATNSLISDFNSAPVGGGGTVC